MYKHTLFPPFLEELEAFKLSKLIEGKNVEKYDERQTIIKWFIDGNWLKIYSKELRQAYEIMQAEDIIYTSRYSMLLEEIIQTMIEYGYWMIPKYIGLKELQQLLTDKNILPMKLGAIIVKLAREVGDQSMTDFIYQY